MRHFDLRLLADYHQFEVRDSASLSDLSIGWTEKTVRDLLVVAPDAIGIGTEGTSYVPVQLLIQEKPDVGSFIEWDQVAECDICLDSGAILIIDGETYLPDARRIKLDKSGLYRLRIYYGGLGYTHQSKLASSERYKLVLWPASTAAETVFLKRWR